MRIKGKSITGKRYNNSTSIRPPSTIWIKKHQKIHYTFKNIGYSSDIPVKMESLSIFIYHRPPFLKKKKKNLTFIEKDYTEMQKEKPTKGSQTTRKDSDQEK